MNYFRLVSFGLVTVLVLAFRGAGAFIIVPPPQGGADMLSGSNPQPVLPNQGVEVQMENQPDVGAVWRFTITELPANSWSVQLGASVTGSISEGDRCLLTFLAQMSKWQRNRR